MEAKNIGLILELILPIGALKLNVLLNEQYNDRLTPILLLNEEARDIMFKPFNTIFISQLRVFFSPKLSVQAGGPPLFSVHAGSEAHPASC
jgi:hypothetical protein